MTTSSGPERVKAISVSERSCQRDGSFVARVSFPGVAEYEVTVTDPAEPGDEARLAWYFEEHLRFPFLDRDWAEDAVRRLRAYGERLFTQVFTGAGAGHYRTLARRGFDGCRLEVTGSAAFHRMHWEALYDPELPVPAVMRMPVTRRVDLTPAGFELPPERSTLNILVVTARPAGPADVGYRTISRPLLDGLRIADRPLVVDLVRPGTWQALVQHLRSATKLHGSGYYQVIHFDVHGAVAGFDELEQGRAADRYLFGSGRLAAFDGERAFLFFETTKEGKAEPVSAQDIADLLAEHRVPVAVLNACQSAKEPVSESSLAQRLVAAGVPVTVGMAYSVTVSAAEKAVPLLYTGLAQGDDLVTAMQTARRSLFDDKARRAYFDQSLDLEDWVLPVVFAQQDVRLQLSEMSVEQQARYFEREALVGDEPHTEYGFVGRDLDIQAIERRLLIREDRNMLLVRGMAGAGKSTLLAHLAWWWQRTGLVEMVFRFSYEDRAWTLNQIVHDVASRLLDKVEQAKLEMLTEAGQTSRIAQLLRARRYLMVLDNTESITATPAAIPHALPEPERERLATFLARLRGGKTLVLFGSREDEQWIGPRTFSDNTYLLPGLDDQAASVLIDAILTRHGGTHHLTDKEQREALNDLTTLLGGYPLPLTVVLPALNAHTPAQVLADLQQGTSDVESVGLINRAIEYSHGKLDPSTQNSLLLLAPFTASIPTGFLDAYHQLLADHDAVKALGPIDLRAAVAETVRVGLAAPHPRLVTWVQILPALPYFLRTRLHQNPDLQQAVRQAHYQLYTLLGQTIQELLTASEPQKRAVGHVAAGIEYANLTTTLNHGLRTGQPVIGIVAAIEEYLDQTKQQDARRHLLDIAIAADREPGRGDLRQELAELHHLAGMVAQDQRRFEEAEAHYRQSLDIKLEFNDRHGAAITHHQLGVVAQDQRRFEEAEAHYRQALKLFEEFNDRHSAASTYHQLGMVAQEQRRFEEAEAHYRQSLNIKLEFNNRHSAAITYHQLGRIAQNQRRFEEAEAHYRQSLDIKLEFNDRYSAASTYHQLGVVAQEQRRFEEAEAHYRQSLNIALEFNDRHGAAITHHQLGVVAQNQRRFEEAEAHCRQALKLFEEFNDRHSAASAYHQLGMVAREQQRFEEAEAHFRQALAIKLEFNDRHSAASTYHQLGRVAQEQRRFEEAEAQYRQALAIKLEFNNRHSAAITHHQLGMLAQEQRRFEEAAAHYRQSLKFFEEFNDRHGTAITYHQLGMLAQEQQRYEEAAEALVTAAVMWRTMYDQWPDESLTALEKIREQLNRVEFERVLQAHATQAFIDALNVAIDDRNR
ncbi:tetratricopeptide repeat protein [Micromonospora sp. NPDC005979]|uniref:tetratricopeptide repeat protein n=1 Tax=Micromonospora sp. NPDC005979 TaxID=3156726 RepID=UPI0033AB1080